MRTRYTALATLCGTLLIFSYSLFLFSSKSRFQRATFKGEKERMRTILSTEEPLIFIGGIPRTGTTLLRVMLDAHQRIRCGEETVLIPYILTDRERWSQGMTAGSNVTEQVIDAAVSAFIVEVIAKHGQPAARYCNKDPFSSWYNTYLAKIFPNAKFIVLIRDSRAVVHSILSRRLPVSGFVFDDEEECFRVWNENMKKMVGQCRQVGNNCLLVHYESLVISPRKEMEKILKFLNEPWSEQVLEHEKHIGEININPLEFSSNQVVKQVYQNALHQWKGYFSDSLLHKVAQLAPMMETLGYEPKNTNPDYSQFCIAEDDD
ncbi:unnamed protein product, partial [Mesorhabditis belari]|uniref:Protein-tyrosine sulfotransferase n=1 Tax=Mesorhabditis belari TaxID=2138241 RepID=A0AAF3ES71_9BILA